MDCQFCVMYVTNVCNKVHILEKVFDESKDISEIVSKGEDMVYHLEYNSHKVGVHTMTSYCINIQ